MTEAAETATRPLGGRIRARRWAAVALIAGGTFALDLAVPLGVACGVPYLALVLLAQWSPRPRDTIFAASIATALATLGFYLSEGVGVATWMVVMNRALAVFAIWATALLCLSFRRADVDHRARLERSEDELRTLFDLSPCAIYLHDADRNLIEVNRWACASLGYTREELLSMKLTDLDGDGEQQPAAHRIGPMPHDERGVFSHLHRRKNGEVFPVEIHQTTLPRRGRELVLSFAIDITERERADADRERLALAIAQADECVIITGADGTIQYVNPAFEQITGYDRESAVGQNPRILKSGEQDDAFYRAMWDVLLSGEPWRGRVRNKRKDGTIYTSEMAISPVRGPSGEANGYVAVQRDVSHVIQIEAELLQAQKMESVGRLAGGVAHDFNNMLTVVLGHASLALAHLDPAQPLRAHLEEIQKAAHRSAGLTQQLLAFARKQAVVPEVLDLNSTVSDMLRMLRMLIGEDIDLVWIPDPALWPVEMDPTQIGQILANLCVNAQDAISGVGKVTIETENTAIDEDFCASHAGYFPGEFVMLAVIDDGCGMDRDTRKRVFEPFFTTKGRGEGTGLGLSTTHGIVKQNGGFVRVDSKPGEGTTFRVYLPRHVGEAKRIRPDDPVQPVRPIQKTVLLVEDELAILSLAKTILNGLGCRVLAANTPSEALRLAREHVGEIHLLVTDVVMPDMDGLALAGQLRSLHPQLKTLFMSGYTGNLITDREVRDEGVLFMRKPFSMEDLGAKVREALGGDRGVARSRGGPLSSVE